MKSKTQIKWGIIGLGNMAHQFAHDLLLVDGAEIYAVASRTLKKAKAFADVFQAKKAYGTYEEMILDKNVDIVYIATPHDSHAELSIKSLCAGKHVLCEKPIALNYHEANKMVQASKANNKFFMEAFWTRFNPALNEVLLKIEQGEIGELKYINADFAFKVEIPFESRMTNIYQGGGSLLDMGVYPLFLTYVTLGIPIGIMASSNFYDSGADRQTAMILQYEKAQAVLFSSFESSSNMVATISGTLGRINLHSIWHESQGFSLIKNNHKVDFHFPTKGKGFTYEIEECHKCMETNQIESRKWSHQNSLDLITMVDTVREKTGLIFPNETFINKD